MTDDLKQKMQRRLDLNWARSYQETSARCHRNFVNAGLERDAANYWADQHRHFAFMARYWLFKAMGAKQESPNDA